MKFVWNVVKKCGCSRQLRCLRWEKFLIILISNDSYPSDKLKRTLRSLNLFWFPLCDISSWCDRIGSHHGFTRWIRAITWLDRDSLNLGRPINKGSRRSKGFPCSKWRVVVPLALNGPSSCERSGDGQKRTFSKDAVWCRLERVLSTRLQIFEFEMQFKGTV